MGSYKTKRNGKFYYHLRHSDLVASKDRREGFLNHFPLTRVEPVPTVEDHLPFPHVVPVHVRL